MFAYPIGQETLCLGRAAITLCIKNAGNIGNRTHTLHLNQQTRLVYFKFALAFTTHWNCSTVKPTFTCHEFFANNICFTGRVADAPYLECISENWCGRVVSIHSPLRIRFTVLLLEPPAFRPLWKIQTALTSIQPRQSEDRNLIHAESIATVHECGCKIRL